MGTRQRTVGRFRVEAPEVEDRGGCDRWLGVAVALLGPALTALTLTLLFNK